MKSELVMAINQICSERNLSQEIIVEAIETSLVSAYKKNFGGGGQNIKARIDMRTGIPAVFAERIVVEAVQDDRFEITLEEAQKHMPDAALGGLIEIDITPSQFGRIAAQTAKQVILQRIREAERDALFSSYVDREGELINGVVASITSHALTLNLGRTEAVMPRNQQVPGDRYRVGQRIRTYVVEVRRTSRGPQIVVSRAHRNMLRRMLELEVPEIFNGTVEIKGISREAGSRSKVAVAALQEGVDPVGSCVGIRGMRIQSIVNELGGEKIDVVEWSADPQLFIANALSPARVNYTVLDEKANPKTAVVVVPDDQLSLAIGKEGQNARLAAKLTGWRIDIKSQSMAQAEGPRPQAFIAAAAQEQRDILAMAEAILLGKAPVSDAQLLEPEPELEAIEVEPMAESELEPEVEPQLTLVAAAEEGTEVVEEQEPGVRATAEAAAEMEPGQERLAEQVVVEPVAPGQEPGLPSRAEREKPKYVYVKDEEMESLKSAKKKARRQKRELVRDDESGALVARRKRKGDDELEGVDWNDWSGPR